MFDHSVSSIVKLNASFVRSFLFLRQELLILQRKFYLFSVFLGHGLWIVLQFCVLRIKSNRNKNVIILPCFFKLFASMILNNNIYTYIYQFHSGAMLVSSTFFYLV